MPYQQMDKGLQLLIEKFEREIFALVFYLTGGDRNKAYDIATAVFAEALETVSVLETNDVIIVKLAAGAVARCGSLRAIPFSDDSDLADQPAAKKASLGMVKRALLELDFDARALLLLRDQLHLSHKAIAAALGVSEPNARRLIPQARVDLRKKIEEALSRGG